MYFKIPLIKLDGKHWSKWCIGIPNWRIKNKKIRLKCLSGSDDVTPASYHSNSAVTKGLKKSNSNNSLKLYLKKLIIPIGHGMFEGGHW